MCWIIAVLVAVCYGDKKVSKQAEVCPKFEAHAALAICSSAFSQTPIEAARPGTLYALYAVPGFRQICRSVCAHKLI